MGNKIEVREGETLQSAIQRLRRQVGNKFSRSWYKTRVGYYEKPSIRKRRQESTAARSKRSCTEKLPLKMKMGLTWLYQRKRPWP